MHQVQRTAQIGKPLKIWVMLQSEQEDEPTSSRNQKRRSLPAHIQMFQLQRRSLSRLRPVPILETQVQQRVATKEICRDP